MEKHTIEHCRSWIGLPGAQTSTLLNQGGIISTETSFQEVWTTIPKECLEKSKESLAKSVQTEV